MKRSVVVIRFGTPTPLPKEFKLIESIVDGNLETAVGMAAGQFGVISILYTDWTLAKIAESFRELANDTGDVLPVMVSELNGPNAGINLKDFPGFDEAVANHLETLRGRPQHNQVNLTLDQLLDLVSQKGLAGLTEEEHELLKKLTSDF